MCKHRILAHNDNGYIVLCKKCNHFQITFGTTVICLSEIQYEEFKLQVEDQLNFYKDDGCPQQKIIQLPTFSVNVQIVLSFNELVKLIELIEEASVLLMVDKIINRVESKTQKESEKL